MRYFYQWWFLSVFVVVLKAENQNLFKLSVAHINDFHARFEQISDSLGPCKVQNTCVGGLARIYTVIKQMKKDDNDYIFLNAGDNYQGSLWYNVFKWNATQYFLNYLPMDAMTFGNHEFDDYLAGIIPFLKNAKVPVVASNIDDSLEPSIQGLFNKSVVIERNDKKIGIIGVVLSLYKFLTNSENLVFLDEVDSINREAERLVREEGVFTNIVVSHCGYDKDRYIAENLGHKVGLIVGGHSHSLLYTGVPPVDEVAVGPYPTVIESKNGSKILVVQASAFTRYLGNITLFYDEDGYVANWEGNPIYLSNSIPQDENILELLKPWKQVLNRYSKVYGATNVTLDITNCFNMECNIGNFVADAMVDAWKHKAENGSWSYASIAMVNSGAIKSNIVEGNITYQDLLTAQPWNNTYDVIELKGSDIKKALDFGTRSHYYNTEMGDMYLLQISGVKVVYNVTKPLGSRVVSIEVLCENCRTPEYEALGENKYYRVVTSSYLILGRDSFAVIKENIRNIQRGPIDVDALAQYVSKATLIHPTVEGRITFLRE